MHLISKVVKRLSRHCEVWTNVHRKQVQVLSLRPSKNRLNTGFERFFDGASGLTGLNKKRSKIKGFKQSINGINSYVKRKN